MRSGEIWLGETPLLGSLKIAVGNGFLNSFKQSGVRILTAEFLVKEI